MSAKRVAEGKFRSLRPPSPGGRDTEAGAQLRHVRGSPMRVASKRTLGIVLGGAVTPRSGGRLSVSRRLIGFVEESSAHWDGAVLALLEPSEEGTQAPDRDLVEVHPADLPFELEIVRLDAPRLQESLARCAVVSAWISSRVNHLPEVCEAAGAPLVYVCERSLWTRLQLVSAEAPGRLERWKRWMWTVRQEWRQLRAIGRAAGVQCNGTPTFEAYGSLTPAPLLFFDGGLRTTEIIEQKALDARLSQRARPIRLVAYGPLDALQGVEHLPLVADALRAAGVSFHLDVFGGGGFEPELRRNVGRLGLTDRVFIHGPVDFRDQVLPVLRTRADLLLCCHRHGDPSRMYLEALGCGVPIAGYGNEALVGILSRIDSGRSVPMDDPEALARVVAEVDEDRARLDRWSRCAASFARSHALEATVRRRMTHLARVAFERPQRVRERPFSIASRLLGFASACVPRSV